MGAIAILDRVTLPAEAAGSWLDRMDAQYAPGARARGMRRTATWTSTLDDSIVEVCVLWALPDVGAFWSMRAAALADPSVDEWWAATDAIARARDRRVYSAEEPTTEDPA